MSKKIVFWISAIISVLLLLANFIGTYKLCGVETGGTMLSEIFSLFKIVCVDALSDIMRTFLIIIPLFLFSLITYKMRDEIYKAWFKFARIWVPLSIILVLISPEYSHGLVPIEKGTISFGMSVIFLVVSIFLIIIKFFSKPRIQ